jgi:hypothetical protein
MLTEITDLNTGAFDHQIMRLWRGSRLVHGLNTWEIARFLGLEESFVANRLARMRDAAHGR